MTDDAIPYSTQLRFWDKVDKRADSECWPWLGSSGSYGRGTFDSAAGSTAPRTAWAIAHNRLPDIDLVVRHTCDNPPCVNPAHLILGTQAENVADMLERGGAGYTYWRCRRGHALTEDNVIYTGKARVKRRCKTCTRAFEAERRRREGKIACPRCDHRAVDADLRRHLKAIHGERLTSAQIREANAARLAMTKADA